MRPGPHAPGPVVGLPPHPAHTAQQPGPGGAPGPDAPARRSRRSLVLTALVTAVVTALVTLGATGALTPTAVFDQRALEDDVRAVLEEDFLLSEVGPVTCPRRIAVRAGAEFECAFVSGGEHRSVPVVVLNDSGQYRVGGPAVD